MYDLSGLIFGLFCDQRIDQINGIIEPRLLSLIDQLCFNTTTTDAEWVDVIAERKIAPFLKAKIIP